MSTEATNSATSSTPHPITSATEADTGGEEASSSSSFFPQAGDAAGDRLWSALLSLLALFGEGDGLPDRSRGDSTRLDLEPGVLAGDGGGGGEALGGTGAGLLGGLALCLAARLSRAWVEVRCSRGVAGGVAPPAAAAAGGDCAPAAAASRPLRLKAWCSAAAVGGRPPRKGTTGGGGGDERGLGLKGSREAVGVPLSDNKFFKRK